MLAFRGFGGVGGRLLPVRHPHSMCGYSGMLTLGIATA
ncbi:hypothetical protein Pd630_LPD13089 (plasmid) [Rhodococcus opacus PD630]|nr:hypothetical protein Pd630_LPD13089 [Rhodococcus opacus PD630]